MRNLDECKAEILRLGDKKIKQRKKKRRRVLSFCIPLCLCLVVSAIVAMPSIRAAYESIYDGANAPQYNVECGAEPSAGATDEFGNMLKGENSVKYTQVEINSFGIEPFFYSKVSDPNEVVYIETLLKLAYDGTLDSGTNDPTSLDGYEPNYSTGKPSYTIIPPGASQYPADQLKGYLISFTTENGDSVVYRIVGNMLKNETTGETVKLTNMQKKLLLSKLVGGGC